MSDVDDPRALVERVAVLETRLDGQATLMTERDRRFDERMLTQAEALRLDKEQLNDRLHLLNQLRGNVLTRAEYEAKHETLVQGLAHLREESSGHAGFGKGRAYTVALIITAMGAMSGWVLVITSLLTHGFSR